MLYQKTNPHGGDIYGGTVKLDFSANTNPFGTPKGIIDAVSRCLPQMHRYPDPYCRELVAAIADHEQVPKSSILCGNGAAELIYAFAQAVRPKTAMELAPTFSEYALGLERTHCHIERYFLRQEDNFAVGEDFLAAVAEKSPEAVFICNPNNPTGQLAEEKILEKLAALCREKNIWLFADECFLDLTDGGKSLKSCLPENPRLVILKAFTKSYGMAGVRLGYCMSANPHLLAEMSAAVQPWNVSSLAQAAGVAALKEGAFLEKTKVLIGQQRKYLTDELEKQGFWVCPSRANFILFWGPENLGKRLADMGIAIRSCDNYHGLEKGWYRIAVRLPEENRMLMDAIRQTAERK